MRLQHIILLIMLGTSILGALAQAETYAYYQQSQPDLETTAYLVSNSTVSIHLYNWYLDGSDDHIIYNTSVVVSGNFTVESLSKVYDTNTRNIFSTRLKSGVGEYSFDFKYSGGTLIHGDIGNGTAWLTTSADASYTYQVNTWYNITYRVFVNGYEIYINNTLEASGTFSGTPLLLDGNHKPIIGAVLPLTFDPPLGPFYGEIAYIKINSSNATLILDASFYNGTYFFDISGNIIGIPYNGVQRVASESKWLWIVKDTDNDGMVHFRFFPNDTVIRVVNESGFVVLEFTVNSTDMVFSLPDGNYTIQVWLPERTMVLDASSLIEDNIVYSDFRDLKIVSDYIEVFNDTTLLVKKPWIIYAGGNPDYNNTYSFFANPEYNVSIGQNVEGGLREVFYRDNKTMNITTVYTTTYEVRVDFNFTLELNTSCNLTLRAYMDDLNRLQVYMYNYSNSSWDLVLDVNPGTNVQRWEEHNISIDADYIGSDGRILTYIRGTSGVSGSSLRIDAYRLVCDLSSLEKIQLNMSRTAFLTRIKTLKEEDGTTYTSNYTVSVYNYTAGYTFNINITNTSRFHFVTSWQPELVYVKDNATGIKRSRRYSENELAFYYPTTGVVYDYTFSIQDPVNYVNNQTYLIVKKWVNSTLVTIYEDKVTSERKVLVPLKYGDMYQLSLDNGYAVRTVGWLVMDSSTSKILTITNEGEEYESGVYINVEPGSIKIYYRDYDNQTLNGSKVYIYNSTGALVFEADLTNDTYIHYVDADENQTYTVVYSIVRPNQNVTYTRIVQPGNPYYQPFPLNLTDMLGELWGLPFEAWMFIVFIVAMVVAVGQLHSGIGLLSGSILAAFFVYVGWLNIPWTIISIALALSGMYAVGIAKKYWSR